MLHSLRNNVYLFIGLLLGVFFLWLINYVGNSAITKQQQLLAGIVRLNGSFDHLLLKEQITFADGKEFATLLNMEKSFYSSCTSCHRTKSSLPAQRIDLLQRYNDVSVNIKKLRTDTRSRLSNLFDSVHYIHEHHIVTLKNFLQYTREKEEQARPVEMSAVYAEEAALEPEIIREAVSIQHQLANIIYDFNTLTSGDVPGEVREMFTQHISAFFNAVNRFEEFSLDAQDGLLVEELLDNGHVLEKSFLRLIQLETTAQELVDSLIENRTGFEQSFLHLENLLQERLFALKRWITFVNWISLALAVCLGLVFLFHARKLVGSIDTLVEETGKISSNIHYRIPEKATSIQELDVLRKGLNEMAAELAGKVRALTDEVGHRREVEKQLSRSKEEWERTFDSVPDMIFILDKECLILRVNQSVLKMFGTPEEELVGKKYDEIFPQLQCEPGQSMEKNELCEFVDQISSRCFSAQRSPLYTDKGEIVGYVSILRDITERIKNEREKQQYASFIDSILASSVHTAIIATDENLRVRYFNREADRLFCTDGKNMTGMSVNEIYRMILSSPDFDSRNRGHLYESAGRILARLQPGEVFEFSFHYAGRVIEARLSVITNQKDEPSGFLLMANDVTERARAEKEQQKMIQRLQKAEKMEAIGLMAGGVAHDLNNILSGIINYPELILMQMQGDEKWKNALESIRDSGLRAAAIVADLLTIARGVASEKVICSMNTLITDFLASPEFLKLAERYPEIEVKTDLAPDLRPCKCSEVHIQKSLMNLFANSFEAIEKKGTVTITTANENSSCYPEKKPNREGAVDECIKIEITDTGKGISEEDARHMFEPFYSRKKMGHSGTGLGLAVVWNTVQDHRGSIQVRGSEQGTVMTILLPSCQDEPDENPEDGIISGLEGQGRKILVVDDEPLQRDVAGQILAVLGYEVFLAANGREAVEFIRNQDVDLVILDMIMEPGMNGRQTLEEILKIKPHQRTLIASGFAESSEVKKACILGKTKLITKPYTLQKLGTSVLDAMVG